MEAEAEAGELEVDLELGLELELGGGGEPSCLRAASKLKFIATEPLEVLAWARAPSASLDWQDFGARAESSRARPGRAGPGQGNAKEWCCRFSVYFWPGQLVAYVGRIYYWQPQSARLIVR